MQQTYLHIYREVICYMLNFSGSINPLLIPIQINLYAILTQVDFFIFTVFMARSQNTCYLSEKIN